jgi:hypothetical protein
MRPLESSTYLKDVLGPYVGSADSPGLFERYCLEPSDDDDAAIAARCHEVKQLWDKRSEHTKYGSLIRALLDQHKTSMLTLEDPPERRRAAAAVSAEDGERAERARQAHADWEDLLHAAIDRHGGLDPTKRAKLERAADSMGVDAAFARAQLEGAPVAAPPPMLAEDARREIRKTLSSLAQDTGDKRLGLSLFHALGLPGVTLDGAQITACHSEMEAENAKRKRDSTRVSYEMMLVKARRLLIDGDPRAYVAGLVADTKEALAAEGTKIAVHTGEIGPMDAERLCRHAVELGLTVDLAQRVVREIAQENDVPLQTGESIDYAVCACGHVTAREHANQRCQNCGEPLFIECPNAQCKTVNDSSAARCSECGADLRAYAAAARKLAGFGADLRSGQLERSREALAEIRAILDSSPEIERCAADLDAAIREAQAGWASAELAIGERRLYAARHVLGQLARTARDLSGPTGALPDDRLTWVSACLRDLDTALERARATSGAHREVALVQALEIAADCEEAREAIARIPAQAPSDVRGAMEGGDAVVSWRASPTAGVDYEVTRIASDGVRELVSAPGPDCRVVDGTVASGAIVRYEVVAVRAQTRSPALSSLALVVARDLRGVSVFDGDGEVRLVWEPVGTRARVRVRRTHDRSGVVSSLTPESAGLIDRDVINGESYSYETCVEYTGPDGAPVLTAERKVFAQPSPLPTPVAIANVQATPTGVRIAVPSPAVGNVTVIRCAIEPTVAVGDQLDVATLADLGGVLPSDPSGAIDADSQAGLRWYLPVTISGKQAVAGEPLRYLALPGVSNVRATDDASSVHVTWSWPDELKVVMVAWRLDRQPDSPDDPEAQRRLLRRSEYRDRGGFAIDAPVARSVFVAVYPAARIRGDVVYGMTAGRDSRTAVTRSHKTDVRYAVRRTGLRKKTLEIELLVPVASDLPEMVIVARPGDLLPRKPDDGEIVGHLGGTQPLQATLDLAQRSRPLTVRVFMASAAAAHRIVDPRVDDLVIR